MAAYAAIAGYCINHHCRNHRDPCPEEVLSKEHASHGGRYQEVQEQVDD